MQLRWHTALFFGLTLLAISGCLKDTETFIPYEEFVETDALGVILSDKDLPVENATVVLEGEMTNTDSNGIFILDDVVISYSGSQLKIIKEGFFTSALRVHPEADNRSLNVRLTAKGQDYNFLSTNPQDLTTPGDVRLVVPPNSFVDANDQDYHGLITANFGWIEPLNKDVVSRIPGGTLGNTSNGESVLLEHYGTVLTSFLSDAGQELKIKTDASFDIYFPIASNLRNSAPSEIPLWFFDEMTGSWTENGTASKEGNYYKATVTESGYWSVQLAFEYATLRGTVKDKDGRGIEHARIALSREGGEVRRRYWTDKDGHFAILYPIREPLQLEIEDECEQVLYTNTVGPFLSRTELSTIEIDPGINYWRITGVVTKCSNPSRGVDKGYSLIRTDDYRWLTPLDDNGAFHTGLFICSSKFIVGGKDLVNQLGVNDVPISDLSGKSRNYSVGTLIACK